MRIWSAAVLPDGGVVRVRLWPAVAGERGEAQEFEADMTDAQAIGHAMVAAARTLRDSQGDFVAELRAERDALDQAIEVLSRADVEEQAALFEAPTLRLYVDADLTLALREEIGEGKVARIRPELPDAHDVRVEWEGGSLCLSVA